MMGRLLWERSTSGARFPPVGAAQDLINRDFFSLFLRELFRPRHPLAGRGPRPGVAVLHVAGGLLVLRLAPVVPPLGPDVVPQLTADEGDAAVRPPGPTEVGELARLLR